MPSVHTERCAASCAPWQRPAVAESPSYLYFASSHLENDHGRRVQGGNRHPRRNRCLTMPSSRGEAADEILGRPAFPYKQTRAQLDLAVVPIAELGFGENGASVRDIYARALGIGLELCPAEVGPTLRLNYLDQPVGEFLDIATHPIARYNGELINFTVGNGGAGLLLIGGDGRPDLVLPGAVRFVFVRPRPEQLVSPPDGELAGR